MRKRTLLTALAALATLAFATSAHAAYLSVGTTNTYTASTTLTGSIAAPALTVKNGYGTSASAYALYGLLTNTAPSANAAAIRGLNSSTNGWGFGLWGQQNGSGTGVYGSTPSGTGVYGLHSGTSGTAAGVKGATSSTTLPAAGVLGSGNNAYGVMGQSGTSFVAGTAGQSGASFAPGVVGCGDTGGTSNFLNDCLYYIGYPGGGIGGLFVGAAHDYANGYGVEAIGRGASGVGIDASGATAGAFHGNVTMSGDLSVAGTITAGTKDFKIDDPLDPAHKYLVHTSVESSAMMDIYTGNVTTDAKGFATVRLPEWFQALNRSFRYQLTILGHAPWDTQARVWNEIAHNRFTIRTNHPNIRVSWQVTGVRHDRYAHANRTQVVVPKARADQGKYLHPELYGKPASDAIYAPQRLNRGVYRVPTRGSSH